VILPLSECALALLTCCLVILKYAGRDATEAYDEIHAPGIAEEGLPSECFKGVIDPSDEPPSPPPEALNEPPIQMPVTSQPTTSQPTVTSHSTKPPLESLISVHDFEDVARQTFTKKTYAFYSSAATDLVAQKSNVQVWRQLLLRPQILRNVSQVSTKRRILGCDSSAPFFVSPTAMAKLAHPDGELATARACGNENIIQCVCLTLIHVCT
jgi:L-lactate dehydrogenase (cytochrome)